jgi:hypothetical protein
MYVCMYLGGNENPWYCLMEADALSIDSSHQALIFLLFVLVQILLDSKLWTTGRIGILFNRYFTMAVNWIMPRIMYWSIFFCVDFCPCIYLLYLCMCLPYNIKFGLLICRSLHYFHVHNYICTYVRTFYV